MFSVKEIHSHTIPFLGYVLSKEAVKRFVTVALDEKKEKGLCRKDEGGAEDVEIGKCLANVGVIAGDSRDSLGEKLSSTHGLGDPRIKTWVVLRSRPRSLFPLRAGASLNVRSHVQRFLVFQIHLLSRGGWSRYAGGQRGYVYV